MKLLVYVNNYQHKLKRLLLLMAMAVFVVGLALYILDGMIPQLGIPAQFVPTSILSALIPALSLLLVYELLLLILSVQEPLVPFIRHMFEVVSLIVLRDLFKKLDQLATDASPQLYIEFAVIAIGSILIYFLVEVLQRIEKNFDDQMVSKNKLPKASRPLKGFKDVLEVVLLALFFCLTIYEAVAWLLGVPNAGFNETFLSITFSGIIVFNFLLLFLSLLATDNYEILFEYSALLLASAIVLIAIPMDPIVSMPMILGALLFVLATLFLHGFAHGQRLGALFKQVKEQGNG
jgi:hypothetical protein